MSEKKQTAEAQIVETYANGYDLRQHGDGTYAEYLNGELIEGTQAETAHHAVRLGMRINRQRAEREGRR